jgi:hypothetical protein
MKARAKRRATKEAKSNEATSYKRKNRIKGENKKPKHNRNFRDEY